MAITWADVVIIAAELSTVATSKQNAILADVSAQLALSQWGSQARLDIAAKYLAAHLASVKGVAPAGPMTSETVGPLTRSFAAPMMTSTNALESTGYGREFLRLRRTLMTGRMMVL